MPEFTLSSNDGAVINPIVADISASSVATANLLGQTTGQITGIDAVFKVIATEAEAVKLLNLYKVTSADSSNTTAAITVDVSHNATAISDFKAALTAIVARADISGNTQHNGSVNASNNMNTYFRELLRSRVNNQLETDGFTNILEAGQVASIDVTTDSTSAAANMHVKMNALDVSDQLIRIIRQNDEKDFEEYYGYMAEVDDADYAVFAPMKAGKTMTFVFDANLQDPTEIQLIAPAQVGTSGYTPAAQGGLSGKIISGGSQGGWNTAYVRVAIVVQMHDKDAYFVRDISQAAVAVGAAPASLSNAAKAEWYRAKYLAQYTGLCPASKIGTEYGYSTVVAPTASSDATARDLGYWNAVGKYVVAMGTASTKALADVLPTIA
jgi:hypothetical protein